MDLQKKASVKTKEKVEKKAKIPSDWEAKCAEYLAGWQRARADYDNLRKTVAEEKKELIRFANADLLTELLPVLDNFKAAYRQIPETEKDSAWVVGFSYIMKQLSEVLTARGITEIPTIGERFDPSLHEAVDKAQDAEKDDGVILAEKKAGYKLQDKVLQAAKVVVNEK